MFRETGQDEQSLTELPASSPRSNPEGTPVSTGAAFKKSAELALSRLDTQDLHQQAIMTSLTRSAPNASAFYGLSSVVSPVSSEQSTIDALRAQLLMSSMANPIPFTSTSLVSSPRLFHPDLVAQSSLGVIHPGMLGYPGYSFPGTPALSSSPLSSFYGMGALSSHAGLMQPLSFAQLPLSHTSTGFPGTLPSALPISLASAAVPTDLHQQQVRSRSDLRTLSGSIKLPTEQSQKKLVRKSSGTVPALSKRLKKNEDAHTVSSASESLEETVDASESVTAESGNVSDDISFGGGERRLVITFLSPGALGNYPQKIGKRNAFVPDGISGRFKMYHEQFTFRTRHGTELLECRDGVNRICITWTVINEASGEETELTETPQEAMRRHVSGKTICNRLYKIVLEKRAQHYEREMELELKNPDLNECRVAHLASMVKVFRPKTFSLGPLAFGLLHSSVQERMLREFIDRRGT